MTRQKALTVLVAVLAFACRRTQASRKRKRPQRFRRPLYTLLNRALPFDAARAEARAMF
jgi:hypothetical protein